MHSHLHPSRLYLSRARRMYPLREKALRLKEPDTSNENSDIVYLVSSVRASNQAFPSCSCILTTFCPNSQMGYRKNSAPEASTFR